MKISVLIGTGFAISSMVWSSALAQPGGPQRGTRAANEATSQVAVSPRTMTIAVPLTSAECKKLGGEVAIVSVCKGFLASACVTTDQSGNTHAVCLERAVKVAPESHRGASRPRAGSTPRPEIIAPNNVAIPVGTPIPYPNNRTDLTAPDDNVVVAPLTIQECKGLGGKQISTNHCGALGQKACATVDNHGVVRVACIDEVAN